MQAIKWVPQGGGRGEASTGSGDKQSVPMTITMTMTMDDSHGQRLAQSSPLIPILSVWGTFNHVRTNITNSTCLFRSIPRCDILSQAILHERL
jgi:hypothetical protein